MDSIAASTTGFTGADLANLINEAALLAGRSDKGAPPPSLPSPPPPSLLIHPLSFYSARLPFVPVLLFLPALLPLLQLLMQCCPTAACFSIEYVGMSIMYSFASFILLMTPHFAIDPLGFVSQARSDRQNLTRPFCGLWQAWRRRGACCGVQRRRAWQGMSVVMPLSAQLWPLSSQPLHRYLLAPDCHSVLVPVLCCAVLRCIVLCCAALCSVVDHM